MLKGLTPLNSADKTTVKCNVTFTPGQATKAQRGEKTPALSLTSAPEGGGWWTPRTDRFTPGKDIPYPLYRRLGGPQSRSELVRKVSHPPEFDPRTVQSVASR
jgi:hypothetical protein